MAFCIRTKIGFSSFFRAHFANYCSKNMNMTKRQMVQKKAQLLAFNRIEILIFEP
jgi:hypothetical protein